MEDTIRVSHSKLQQWRRCRFAWNLSYVGKWEPIKTAYPLKLGSLIHELLEDYYRGVMDGERDSIQRLSNTVQEKSQSLEDQESLQALSQGSELVRRYIEEFAIYEDVEFLPVDVEKHYVVELETPKGRKYEFELYFDLLLMHKESRKLWMVDHKTHKSRPFSDIDIMMDPQLPAYAMVMREKLGIDIFGLVYNQINTYDYKNPAPADKLFSRKKTYRTPEELDTSVAEIGAVVDDMIENQDNPYRNLTRDCSWCKFQEPCLMDMKGMDMTPILETSFQQKKERPVEPLESEESSLGNHSL